MKNKIINWTFGSVFRTIGRVVAYLLIGLLISTFVFKKEYVKAMSLDGQFINQKQVSNNEYTNSFYKTSSYDHTTGYFYFNGNVNSDNADYLMFTLISLVYGYDQSTIQEHYGNSGSGVYSYTLYNSFISQLRPRIYLMSNEAGWSPCELQNNFIVCSVYHNINYYGLRFEVDLPENETTTRTYWDITINNYANLYKTTTSAITGTIENQTQQQEQQHNETINTLTNDTSIDTNETSNIFEEFEDYLPDEGIVTQLVTLPISLYTNILNSVNGTCQAFSLGSLLGTNLTLPCINVANYLGSQLWSVIDILMSGFFILTIGRKFIKVFENMSSMKEGDVLGD